MILSLWDHTRKDTLRLDLWTKEMTVDEMKIFFHQTLVTMADTLEKSINDPRISGDMRDFCAIFCRKWKLPTKEKPSIPTGIVLILNAL
jgi:gliding motility-associated protein GldC